MRIAFVSVSDRMGGSEVVLLEIVRGLRRIRPAWNLQLVAPGEGPLTGRAAVVCDGTTVLDMPSAIATFGEAAAVNGRATALPLRLLGAAAAVPEYQRSMNETLERLSPDVVHTNGFKAHLFGARAAAGPAVVWHLHEYVSQRPITKALLRRYSTRCAAIVANSTSVADDARSIVHARDVRVIHNGVDLHTFSPHGERADLDALCGLPSAPAGTVRAGLVATFARWKGHAVFLRAVAALAASGLQIRAYAIGGPIYDTRGSQRSMDELKAMARELRIEDRIGFTGFVDAPAAAIRALDIVIHASTDREPFGMAIAEAMACGRAVVTSGLGGASELVTDGVDAVVHRAGDAASLAECIERLASDATARQRLGERARATAVERFDGRRMAEQFAAVYEEAAGRRGRP